MTAIHFPKAQPIHQFSQELHFNSSCLATEDQTHHDDRFQHNGLFPVTTDSEMSRLLRRNKSSFDFSCKDQRDKFFLYDLLKLYIDF